MISSLLTSQAFQQMSQECALNRQCFECNAPSPTWASLPNAIFLCLTCSGIHRSLGVHISFVRSITMDAWSEKQLKMMMNGGNERLRDFFTTVGIYNEENRDKEISWKYRTKAASYYREMIRAKVEEKEPPAQLSAEEWLMEDALLAKSQPIINSQKAQVEFQPMKLEPPEPEDPLDKVKNFFVVGIQKTADLSREAIKKVDEKYHDEEFQQKLTTFKTDASQKASELAEKTKVAAEKGYGVVKEGATSAWGFLRSKFNELQNKNEQPIANPSAELLQ